MNIIKFSIAVIYTFLCIMFVVGVLMMAYIFGPSGNEKEDKDKPDTRDQVISRDIQR